jgi:hypothetical protein
MARMQISTETSTWLLQAKDFLVEARRLKPGPARNELRHVAKVLRELAKLEAQSESAGLWSAGESLKGRMTPLVRRASPPRLRAPNKCSRYRLPGTAHMASPVSPTEMPLSSDTTKPRDRAVFIEKISSTSRRMLPWHSHAAATSRARSISIWPRRSDLIAPDARRLRIRSVTVVRCTPSICDSASWVSGRTSWSIRS